MPKPLQVGINAYPNWASVTTDAATFNREMVTQPQFQPDLIVRSDYVRFRRPQLSVENKTNIAAGKLSGTELMQLLGE